MRLPYLLLILVVPFGGVAAQTPAPTPKPAGCVDVEVNGYRALSFDCLNQQLAPVPRAPHDNPALASENIAARPPNQLGLANPATTSNRMGNTFGKSAHGQRPPAKSYSSPLPGR